MQPFPLSSSMRKVLPLVYTGLLLAVLYLYLLYSLVGRLALWEMLLPQLPLLLVAVVLGSGFLWSIHTLLIVRIPWQRYPGLRFVLSCLLLWSAGIVLVKSIELLLQENILATGLYGADNRAVFLITGAIVTLILSLLFTLCDFSWYTYYRFAAHTLAVQKAQRRQRELQFDVLRAQLTPHYLFNSLNTASNLVLQDSSRAEEYLRKLAHNIKHLLAQPQQVLSSLAHELELVDSFFHLMQVRYGERIQLQKQINEKCLQRQIPALALQLLVENAIKHNVASTEQPVRIFISADSGGIAVQNNITRSPQKLKSGKVGLLNLQERYQYLCGKALSVEHTESSFSVLLPYISSQRKEGYEH